MYSPHIAVGVTVDKCHFTFGRTLRKLATVGTERDDDAVNIFWITCN